MSIKINREHMNYWGMTEEELWELAQMNTPRLFPVELNCLADVLLDLLNEQLKESMPNFGEEMLDGLMDDYRRRMNVEETVESQIVVLSNTEKLWGASTILYPGALKEAARQLGSDLVILPSSVHEVIIVPQRDILEYANMADMVKEINQREVPPEDIE